MVFVLLHEELQGELSGFCCGDVPKIAGRQSGD